MEDGTEINTTENHPFYVEGKGWCAASGLEDGDILHAQDGSAVTVKDVEARQLDEAVKVYNLEIEEYHTYYVSGREVLVHNVCDVESGSNAIDYYVGPNGKVLPSQYKDWIGTNIQEELLSQAENPQLKNAIKQLYRGKSFIGDGGTADVIRFEQETGIMLGKNGGSHVQKGIDMASYIQNKILTQNLSDTDRTLVTRLLDDLNSALGR